MFHRKDGRGIAISTATEARGYKFIGVTFDSAEDEYGGYVEDFLLPATETSMPISNAPWLDDEIADAKVNRYHDADAPALAASVARAFPENQELASYATKIGPSTAWCGVYQAAKLAKYGILAPFWGPKDVERFAWVGSWKNWGMPIAKSALQPGDMGLWLNEHGLHHIACYAGDGEWIGGNQGNTVSRIRIPIPSVIRRPPAASSVSAVRRPMLMRNSVGADVIEAQELLIAAGFDVGPDGADGEFGENTEAAVRLYQIAKNLEVDGIIGDETWTSLLTGAGKPPAKLGALTPAVIEQIVQLARADPIAKFYWPAKGTAAARGVAPIGYTCGMAVAFAQTYRDLKAGKSYATAMVRPIGGDKDALAIYGVLPNLPTVFAFLLGLGMQESSGNYTEGRDIGAGNTNGSDTEAGLFQQSWDSNVFSPEIGKLLANPPADCFASIFREGITPKSTPNYGSGNALKFQQLAKSCPMFAVACAGVLIRVASNHFGPINRKEVTLSAAAIAMFEKVARLVDAMPLDGDIIDPGDEPEEPPPPAPVDRTTLILFVLLLTLLREQDMSKLPPGFTKADLDRALALALAQLAKSQEPAAPAPAPPPATVPATLVGTQPPDLRALIALVLARLAPEEAAGGGSEAKPPPEPPPPPKTSPAPIPGPTPGLQRPDTQAFAGATALVAILQFLGVVGTPFGMGTEPTDTGTALTLLTGVGTILSTTGIFGSLGRGIGRFLISVGEWAGKYQPPKK